MRTPTILSVALGTIALTFISPVPRASAMTTGAPAAIDAVAPNNGQVQKVRTVCRRYRYWRHGRWHYRTRCYNTHPNRYYRRYPPPPPPRYYRNPYRYYYR